MGMIFGEDTSITQSVCGVEWKFWPLSVSGMYAFKSLYGPLGSAIVALTESRSSDTASVFREVGDAVRDETGKPIMFGNKPLRDTESSVEAISPELAKVRLSQREKAVADVVSAIMDDTNKEAFARIVIDCTRLSEQLPEMKEGMKCPPAKSLFDQIGLDAIPDLVKGIAKANKGVFGPLTETLGPLLAQVRGEVDKRLSENAPNPQTKHGEDSPTQSSE